MASQNDSTHIDFVITMFSKQKHIANYYYFILHPILLQYKLRQCSICQAIPMKFTNWTEYYIMLIFSINNCKFNYFAYKNINIEFKVFQMH